MDADAENLGRIEAALERIARAQVRAPAAPAVPDPHAALSDGSALAARLDAAIARIEEVLGPESGPA